MSNGGRRQQRSGRGHGQEYVAESQLWSDIVGYLKKISSAGDEANEGIAKVFSTEAILKDGATSKFRRIDHHWII